MELEQAVEKRVAEIAAFEEAAEDFKTLLDNLPPGQVKNLLKSEICGKILKKYGVNGE